MYLVYVVCYRDGKYISYSVFGCVYDDYMCVPRVLFSPFCCKVCRVWIQYLSRCCNCSLRWHDCGTTSMTSTDRLLTL